MKRGDKTTIGELGITARFYKEGDKDKRVFEITGKSLGAANGKGFYYAECVVDGGNPKYPDKLKSTLPVIFLRYESTLHKANP